MSGLIGTLPNGDQIFQTNYSSGYVIEYVDKGDDQCESWLLIPAENLWSVAFRGFIYLLAMLYMFVGIAIISDIFMSSIEVITSQSRIVVKYDEERNEKVEKEVSKLQEIALYGRPIDVQGPCYETINSTR